MIRRYIGSKQTEAADIFSFISVPSVSSLLSSVSLRFFVSFNLHQFRCLSRYVSVCLPTRVCCVSATTSFVVLSFVKLVLDLFVHLSRVFSVSLLPVPSLCKTVLSRS